ncbi:MAG: DUF3445 domain-containing protein [Pseudomonadota bacterium]
MPSPKPNSPVLQPEIPQDQRDAAARRLPGIQPVPTSNWLTIDTAYSDQLAQKARLMAQRREEVCVCLDEAHPAAQELMTEVLHILQSHAGFDINRYRALRPDGVRIDLDWEEPLVCLSQLIQEDLCILQKHSDTHVLTGALLCFPASWTLSEKIGRGLPDIHVPVPEYSDVIARRVQRLFDGVQIGQPLWRANLLNYTDPSLFHPRLEAEPRHRDHADAKFERSERQTLLRLPESRAVIFAIHTSIVRSG